MEEYAHLDAEFNLTNMVSTIQDMQVEEESDISLTPSGIEMLFDILDHVASTGALDNIPNIPRDDAVAVMAAGYVDLVRYRRVLHPEDYYE